MGASDSSRLLKPSITKKVEKTSTSNGAKEPMDFRDKFLAVAFAAFLTAFGMMTYTALTSTELLDFDRGLSDYFYLGAAFFMATGILVSAFCYFTTDNADKKNIAAILITLNLAECLCFLALRFRFSTGLPDPNLGTPVELARYLEWAYGPTALIVIFSKITQSKRSIFVPIISWIIMVWLGYASMLYPESMNRNLIVPAHMAFIYALVKIWVMFDDALGSENPPMSKEVLRLLQVHCMIAWSIFTVVFVGQIGYAVSAEATECWYALSSTLTKFPFTLIVINSSLNFQGLKSKTA